MAGETLEVLVGEYLRQRGWRLALAESCTGGLIGHRITNVPGSSTYYMGSVTAYAYEAKVRLLGVRWETLEKHGAVSPETVLEMARGVRQALAADVGLSVSGIAGPGGGTPDKPVGLVWIGLNAPSHEEAWSHHFKGGRLQVKEQAAERALHLLADYLAGPGVRLASASEAENIPADGEMESIEVIARLDSHGRSLPVSFTWNGQTFFVDSTGRSWQDALGQHILVMVPGGQVFELLYAPLEGCWYLARQPAGGRFA